MLARQHGVPLKAVSVEFAGVIDRGSPVREDLTLFNSVRLRFHLKGVTEDQGAQLIESFKGR